jgi:hypothetical protein
LVWPFTYERQLTLRSPRRTKNSSRIRPTKRTPESRFELRILSVEVILSSKRIRPPFHVLQPIRAVGQNKPDMSGIAESLSIVMTSDVIVSIFQNEEDQEMCVIRLGMMKNRFGPRGMVQAMRIDYSTLSIFQADDEEECMSDEELTLLEQLSD